VYLLVCACLCKLILGYKHAEISGQHHKIPTTPILSCTTTSSSSSSLPSPCFWLPPSWLLPPGSSFLPLAPLPLFLPPCLSVLLPLVQIQATESYHRLQLLLQGLQQVLLVLHRERTEGH